MLALSIDGQRCYDIQTVRILFVFMCSLNENPCKFPPYSDEQPLSEMPIVVKDKKDVRLWLDGAFDMTHYGHMNAFRQGESNYWQVRWLLVEVNCFLVSENAWGLAHCRR